MLLVGDNGGHHLVITMKVLIAFVFGHRRGRLCTKSGRPHNKT